MNHYILHRDAINPMFQHSTIPLFQLRSEAELGSAVNIGKRRVAQPEWALSMQKR